MLHILTPKSPRNSILSLKDVFNHRVDFLSSEGLAVPSKGRDSLDTEETIYLAYHHEVYGMIGSARLFQPNRLPPDLQACFPKNQRVPFVFGDCFFHVPEECTIFQHTDYKVETTLETLMRSFYESLRVFIENQVERYQSPFIYFHLPEEDFDHMQQCWSHDIYVLKEIAAAPDQENLYFGAIDFAKTLSTTPPCKTIM